LLFPVGSAPASEAYREVLTYKAGQPKAALAAVEAEIRGATPEELRAIEERLLATLRSPAATVECKDWVCRQLRMAGSDRAVPSLVSLLSDPDLHTPARLALQSLPGREVDAALRRSLTDLDGELKAGVVLTLGARGDPDSVVAIVPLLESSRRTLVEAALYALGHIGGTEALPALKEARVPEELRRYRLEAMLLCAEGLARGEHKAEAAAAYLALFRDGDDPLIQAAALRGLVVGGSPEASSALLDALQGPDATLRAAAAKFACELGDAAVRGAVLEKVATLPTESQVLLLGLWTDRAALPNVGELSRGARPGVRVAALDALGRLGDASSVNPLLEAASTREEVEREVARRALRSLRSDGVEAALTEAASSGEAPRRVEALGALADRGAEGSIGVLLRAIEDPDGSVQGAGLDALARAADPRALPELLELLVAVGTDDGQRPDVARAVLETCRRSDDRAAVASAFQVVADAVDATDESVRASVREVLARWPDPAALPDLLKLARGASSPDTVTLALRSLARLAALPGGPPAAEKASLLAEGLKLAGTAEERKALVDALSGIEHVKALEVAEGLLQDRSIEVEAATAVVKIAKLVRKTDPDRAAQAIQKILDTCQSTTARQVAESSAFVPPGMINVAAQGTATSPDGLETDGAAGGDGAAIDGNPATYWDEEDGQKLYRLLVTFPRPRKIFVLSIMGYEHHRYAPRDFEILCDGVPVKKVENAQYDSNFLVVPLEPINLTTLELKITGYYGASPAIRELGIYRRVAGQ
jgi:HEAT repeat protein